jgi:AraC-like DNA-binding protein
MFFTSTALSAQPTAPTDGKLQEASCLSDPARLLFASSDLDQVRGLVSGVMKAHQLQLSTGVKALDARMHHVPLGELSLSRLDYGATVYIHPEAFESFYVVTMPVHGTAHIQSGGQRLDASPELAAVLNPQCEYRMCWHAGNEQIILKLSRPLLEQTLAGHLGQPLEQPLAFELGFRWQDCAPWRSLLSYLLACATQYPDLMRHQLLHSQLEQMVASALLLMQRHNHSDTSIRRRAIVLPRHVRRAQDYLQAHVHEPVTTAQLALLSGVSVRSLNAGFQEFLGVSPMHYLRGLRLQRARDELLNGSGSQVASVALRWGFEHMGRFASQYRQTFGESPSQTLRRR